MLAGRSCVGWPPGKPECPCMGAGTAIGIALGGMKPPPAAAGVKGAGMPGCIGCG